MFRYLAFVVMVFVVFGVVAIVGFLVSGNIAVGIGFLLVAAAVSIVVVVTERSEEKRRNEIEENNRRTDQGWKS